jgi:phosphoesterase RecJ-like protein
MDPNLRNSIRHLIEDADHILLVSHVAPDGDAIGSLLGLGWLLGQQGKKYTLACQDPVPDSYFFLPGSRQIVHQVNGTYDLVISLDCSDRYRMGTVMNDGLADLPLINIDHHVTNTGFGAVNWVDPATVSTTQMVLTLADALGWELTPQVAVCLLNGLVTDTRSFRTANVDAAAMRAALRLMEAGASLSQITRQALEQRPLASVRLWGEAIARMQTRDGLLWTWVTAAMRLRWNLGLEDASGLANFLSGIREARIVIVFTEREEGTVDVSMRAAPDLDVAQAALRLGGGGHPQAAGCTLEGDPAEIERRVLAEVGPIVGGQGVGGP